MKRTKRNRQLYARVEETLKTAVQRRARELGTDESGLIRAVMSSFTTELDRSDGYDRDSDP